MIAFGYCLPPIHEGMLHGPFVASMLQMLVYDMRNRRLLTDMLTEVAAYIPAGRNKIVERFLTETEAEWLLFLDYDMVFDPDILYKLVDFAGDDKKIIGALYFNNKTMPDGTRFIVPVWRQTSPDGLLQMSRVTSDVQELTTLGMGFTLIHRTVLQKMAVTYHDDPWHWYGHDIVQMANGPSRAGEDITFCLRAKKAGFQVYGAPLLCQHIKSARVTFEDYKKQVELIMSKAG